MRRERDRIVCRIITERKDRIAVLVETKRGEVYVLIFERDDLRITRTSTDLIAFARFWFICEADVRINTCIIEALI